MDESWPDTKCESQKYDRLILLCVFAGETLLSPLVMCGPHGLKFLKPVELRLPHCASMTPDGWSFALKSSDSSSGTPYFLSVLLMGPLVSVWKGLIHLCFGFCVGFST